MADIQDMEIDPESSSYDDDSDTDDDVVIIGETKPTRNLETVSLDLSPQELAERKKGEGNDCYRNKDYKDYKDAVRLYSEAIDLCPECASYYSNRSACHMMLGKYKEALQDAREAVKLDPSFVKGYIRVGKCNIALGDATAALSILRVASDMEPHNKTITEEINNANTLLRCQDDASKAETKGDQRMAIFHIDRALSLALGCKRLKVKKAEYLVVLTRYADAQEIVNEILQFDNANPDAIYVRGLCLYYQDRQDQAFTHFTHVLRLAPDHKGAKDAYKRAKQLRQKKEEGNLAFNKGQLREALQLYTDALAIDPNNKATNSKLFFNRATVRAKIGQMEEAVEDCSEAITIEDGYVKAYLRRAKCYHDMEKYDDEVRDYEKVLKLDRSQEHKRLLHEAKLDLKRSKRKDYYKILGVAKAATEDEIKKSYRKMALIHHPDRHSNGSEKVKREHEVKFKEVGEAYAVLTDTKKRNMFDNGHDVNDPDAGMTHADVDPNTIFQAFFQQGGSPFGGGAGQFHGANFHQFHGQPAGPGGFSDFHFQFG